MSDKDTIVVECLSLPAYDIHNLLAEHKGANELWKPPGYYCAAIYEIIKMQKEFAFVKIELCGRLLSIVTLYAIDCWLYIEFGYI